MLEEQLGELVSSSVSWHSVLFGSNEIKNKETGLALMGNLAVVSSKILMVLQIYTYRNLQDWGNLLHILEENLCLLGIYSMADALVGLCISNKSEGTTLSQSHSNCLTEK